MEKGIRDNIQHFYKQDEDSDTHPLTEKSHHSIMVIRESMSECHNRVFNCIQHLDMFQVGCVVGLMTALRFK